MIITDHYIYEDLYLYDVYECFLCEINDNYGDLFLLRLEALTQCVMWFSHCLHMIQRKSKCHGIWL